MLGRREEILTWVEKFGCRTNSILSGLIAKLDAVHDGREPQDTPKW